MSQRIVKVELSSDFATVPERKTDLASGYDVSTPHDIIIPSHGCEIMSSEVALEMPESIYAEIHPRSSTVKKGILIQTGIIDSDYRGVIQIIMYNHTSVPVKFCRGDRIAQLVFRKRVDVVFIKSIVNKNGTKRGIYGLGSTGR